MARSKRNLLATARETSTPPSTLPATQSLAKVLKATGNNLYSVALPSGQPLLVELPARFRSTIWLRRGGFVLVDRSAMTARENKIDGEVVNVVRDEKAWRKMRYWPAEFAKRGFGVEDGDDEAGEEEEESVVGKMPPSDSEEDSEEGEEERGG